MQHLDLFERGQGKDPADGASPYERRLSSAELVFTAASDVEVTRTGGVAWIRRRQTLPGGELIPEVRSLDNQGERLLDSGVGVELESLAVSGSRVFWINEGSREVPFLSARPR